MLRILGQGLAGTILAWRCHEAGVPFQVTDDERPTTASKLAAGLVTPISGKRLALLPDLSRLGAMEEFYAWVSEQLGEIHYKRCPIVRILTNLEEAEIWQGRLADPKFQNEISPLSRPIPSGIQAPYGCFQQRRSGLLDVRAFLQASKAFFKSSGYWVEIDEASAADKIVHCTGPWGKLPLFGWAPLRFSHGDLLTLKIDDLMDVRIFSGRCWIRPVADGLFEAGATYNRIGSPDTAPSSDGRAQLEAHLLQILSVPFEVIDHRAAVRPATITREPLIGRHPTKQDQWIFNGLGSKGVFQAPWFAKLLVDHWTKGAHIPPANDIALVD